MQVENNSLRLWTVRDINCIPGQITEVLDEYAPDLVGHPELKVVESKPKKATKEKEAAAE